jgi:hypothetical protein
MAQQVKHFTIAQRFVPRADESVAAFKNRVSALGVQMTKSWHPSADPASAGQVRCRTGT